MGISLEKMERTAPDLVNLYKKAAVSLEKHGLTGTKAAVYLVLDHSGSMRELYRNGTVQHFTEQVLGLSAQLDDDGVVPVVFFHDGVYPAYDVTIGQHQGAINALRRDHRLEFGMTSYAPAMQTVINHYTKSGATDPALVVFETDGRSNDMARTHQLLRDAAKLPLFWQFVGFGRPSSPEFAALRTLDTLDGRVVDNAGFFGTGDNPREMIDEDVYTGLTQEFGTWIQAARAAGVLR